MVSDVDALRLRSLVVSLIDEAASWWWDREAGEYPRRPRWEAAARVAVGRVGCLIPPLDPNTTSLGMCGHRGHAPSPHGLSHRLLLDCAAVLGGCAICQRVRPAVSPFVDGRGH